MTVMSKTEKAIVLAARKWLRWRKGNGNNLWDKSIWPEVQRLIDALLADEKSVKPKARKK